MRFEHLAAAKPFTGTDHALRHRSLWPDPCGGIGHDQDRPTPAAPLDLTPYEVFDADERVDDHPVVRTLWRGMGWLIAVGAVWIVGVVTVILTQRGGL